MDSMKLTKANSELRDVLDALQGGGGRYLRTVELVIRQRKNRLRVKDGGVRWAPSKNDPGKNGETVDRMAVALEEQLGLDKEILVRAVSLFRERFEQLVRSWLKCRPDAKAWAEEHPGLWKAVERATGEIYVEP